jgi:hypothetical protein
MTINLTLIILSVLTAGNLKKKDARKGGEHVGSNVAIM